jgi:hypothetical protein
MANVQVLKRKSRTFAPAEVDRLEGEQEFEEMVKNVEENKRGKRR